jgi:hypothetical protein
VSADLRDEAVVLLNEADNGFAVVLRDVLCFVLPLFLLIFRLVFRLFMSLAVLVLGDALLLSDHPGLFVEEAVGDQWHNGGVAGVYDQAVPVFALDDAVEHGGAVPELGGGREDVIKFNFAMSFVLLWRLAVVEHGHVEERVFPWLDEYGYVGNVGEQAVPFYQVHKL